jgi:MFS family permease
MTTVYAITYALAPPTAAAIAARIPRKALLLSSLSTFVVANLATAVVASYSLALATRVLAGLGAANRFQFKNDLAVPKERLLSASLAERVTRSCLKTPCFWTQNNV